MYLRDRLNRPFGAVVYNGKYFGYSLCNPKDHFSYDLARRIAVGRMYCTRKDWRAFVDSADPGQQLESDCGRTVKVFNDSRMRQVYMAMAVLEEIWNKRSSGSLASARSAQS